MTDLHQLVCDECGDRDVMTEAWASMNSETGRMEFEESLRCEDGFCRTCEDYIKYRYTYKINGKKAVKATIW